MTIDIGLAVLLTRKKDFVKIFQNVKSVQNVLKGRELMAKKIVALLLSVIIVFSATVSVNAYTVNSIQYLMTDEIKTVTTAQILKVVSVIKKTLNVLVGRSPDYESNMTVELNEGKTLELCTYIRDNSGLDIEALCESFSLDTTLLEKTYTLTSTDTTAIRNSLYNLRRKCDEEGNSTLSVIIYFLENYLTVMKKIDIYTIPFGDDGTTRVGILITRMDGTTENIPVDIYFSPDGRAYGKDGNGILGLGFECSVYDLVIYATVNCWMRNFGFCFFYDWFCYTTPFFDYVTRRFKFEYDGEEWMIQTWKGNYVAANGCEIGIYNREKGSFGTYYNCYDGLMNMSFSLKYGDETILEAEGEHWWLNGFKLSTTLYKPSAMKLNFTVELLDEEMAECFAESVNNHYMHDTLCIVDGKTVSVSW